MQDGAGSEWWDDGPLPEPPVDLPDDEPDDADPVEEILRIDRSHNVRRRAGAVD